MTQVVLNCTQYEGNPYQGILHSHIGDRYSNRKATVGAALAEQEKQGAKRPVLLHIHWEEHILRKAPTRSEAILAVERFLQQLREFKALGGVVFLTIHNLLPHELEHVDVFQHLRAKVLQLADRVLIHSTAALSELTQAYAFDHGKVYLLPHPSYQGIYGPVAEGAADSQELLIFGMVRRYKAIDVFCDLFVRHELSERGYRLRVCGAPLAHEAYAEDLLRDYGAAPGICFEFRRFADEEIAPLFSSAAALILPYERFLTSGILMASMTLGLPVIAPALPQVREVLPTSQHAFLYDLENEDSCIERIETLLSLNVEERAMLRNDLLRRAEHYAPKRISTLLGRLYDYELERRARVPCT